MFILSKKCLWFEQLKSYMTACFLYVSQNPPFSFPQIFKCSLSGLLFRPANTLFQLQQTITNHYNYKPAVHADWSYAWQCLARVRLLTFCFWSTSAKPPCNHTVLSAMLSKKENSTSHLTVKNPHSLTDDMWCKILAFLRAKTDSNIGGPPKFLNQPLFFSNQVHTLYKLTL